LPTWGGRAPEKVLLAVRKIFKIFLKKPLTLYRLCNIFTFSPDGKGSGEKKRSFQF
jgi:hypothetical protein